MGKGMSQSLSIRAMSFDDDMTNPSAGGNRSQSLSIRAMSFDGELGLIQATAKSLNPFRSGQCLSTLSYQKKQSMVLCLNPFRSGQCLSTAAVCWRQESCGLSDLLPNFFGRLRSWLLI